MAAQGAGGRAAAAAPVSRESLQGLQARTVGLLMGKMCGDVLGAAVEGGVSFAIQQQFPEGLSAFVRTGRGYGCYTDDTQMAIALARSLVELGRCDMAHCARAYAQEFQPFRGYGQTAFKIIADLRRGADPRVTGTTYIPGGSFANGGAMRIAPLGYAYRNASPEVLLAAVWDALRCTHTHPIALDGAFVVASAVGLMANSSPGPASQPAHAAEAGAPPLLTPGTLLDNVAARAQTPELQGKLQTLRQALLQGPAFKAAGQTWADYLESPGWQAELQMHNTVADYFQIRADDAAAAALLAVCWHWGRPLDALVAAVHYGGDTDTIAAIAGGMLGALHGAAWLPDEWWSALENGRSGRDEVCALALRLAELDVRT